VVDAVSRARDSNQIVAFEYSLDMSAEIHWYEAHVMPSSGGQSIMLAREITKFKQAQEKITRQLEQLASLRTIDLAIASGLDLNLTLSIILDHIRKQLGVDAAAILLMDQREKVFKFAAGSGFQTHALQSARLRVGEGYAGIAALEHKIIHIPNLKNRQTDFLRSPLFKQEGFVAYYAVPLSAKGQTLGVLEIFQRAALHANSDWLEFMNMIARQAAIAIDNAMLFRDLQLSTSELTLAYDKTIEGWARALDLRDRETEGHTRRVTEMTLQLASHMGMEPSEMVHVRRGAMLHDIGKVAIPDYILLKAGKLTDEEQTIMRRHPLIAVELLTPIQHLAPALAIPRSHHEKWDGSGYPEGLAGENIPLAARIFAVVDVYDALTSNRPYRGAWSHAQALEYIRSQAGKHFDPKVVQAFIAMINKSP
jgi:HD-GYP domain-containing protein (c-di-GMP phosphodiesterase class II)